MKRKILKTGLLAILALLVFQGAYGTKAEAQAQAQSNPNEYTMLTPLPCVGDDQDCNKMSQKTTLEKYVPGLFKLAIGLAAAAAVFMIVIGGFQYMTTDAIQGKKQGKDRIMNAIYGLVLVIGAWLILNTINPKLLEINLNIEPATTTQVNKGTLGGELSAGTGKILPGYTLTQAQVETNNKMVKDLKDNYGINVNAGPCTDGGTTGCTNLVGMTEIAFKGVTDLKKVCTGCNITISGGTEGGHASHGPNLAPMDLRFDTSLDNYIIKNQVAPPQTTSVGTVYTSKVGTRNATFLRESDHWHVVFE